VGITPLVVLDDGEDLLELAMALTRRHPRVELGFDRLLDL
jgi:hypothetical protein